MQQVFIRTNKWIQIKIWGDSKEDVENVVKQLNIEVLSLESGIKKKQFIIIVLQWS